MTLRRKIVSLTFGILVLFAATAFTAMILQDRIGRRFDGVVRYQMPLNAAIGEIDVLTDRYELKQLRLIADLSATRTTAPGTLDQYEADRAEEAKAMGEAVARVKELLASALQDPIVNTDDRIALAEVRGRFSYMDRAMPDFLAVGQRLTTTTQQATTSVFVQLELNGLARVGTSPLELLRRSVPGYVPTNDTSLRERDRRFEPLPEF